MKDPLNRFWTSATLKAREHQILLLNDPRDQQNWGCEALVVALQDVLRQGIGKFRLRTVLSKPLMDKGLPGKAIVNLIPACLDDFPRCRRLWLKGKGGPLADEIVEMLRETDLLIYNAEGMVYRSNHSAFRCLFICWLAATEFNIPTVFINGGVHLTDVEAFLPPIAQAVFPTFSRVAVREPCSLRNLQRYVPDVKAEVVPDSAYFMAANGHARELAEKEPVLPFKLEEDFFCVSTGMLPYSRFDGREKSAITELVLRMKERVPQCVFLAKDKADQFLEMIADATDSPFLGSDHDFDVVLQLQRRARFQLTGRYHLLILGATVGCPTIPFMSLSHKLQGTAELLQPLIGTVYNPTALRRQETKILADVDSCLERGDSLRQDLEKRSRELGEQCGRFAELAREALIKSNRTKSK